MVLPHTQIDYAMSDRVTIWIVNEAGHDFSKATEAVPNAMIQPLTIGDINPTSFDRLAFNAARGIAKFAKAEDFILISGTPILNAIVVALWIQQFGVCNILQWDARRKKYRRFDLNSKRMREMLEEQMIS